MTADSKELVRDDGRVSQVLGRFIGRESEMATLQAMAARARDGNLTAVVIEGEAGVGKSRLVVEAVSELGGAKDIVALGHGVELAAGELAYGAAADCLRSLVRDVGVGEVSRAAGPYVTHLACLCPLLGPSAGETDRSQLLPAFVHTLESLSSDRLVWLVIEDWHWSDLSSRDLLTYLLRVGGNCRVLVVITTRTHDGFGGRPGHEPDAMISLIPGVTWLTLQNLDKQHVAALANDMSGGQMSADELDHLYALSRGNPLLTGQLMTNGLHAASTNAAIVRGPTLSRLDELDSNTRRLLQMASIAIEPLPHRLLQRAHRLAGGTDAVFAAAIVRSIDSGLLTSEPGSSAYSFPHALVREAVSASLGPLDRLANHRTWAQLLSRADNHSHDPRLQIAAAHHWAAADTDIEAFDAALDAARHATRLHASAEAARLMQRALALWDRVPNAADRAGRQRDDLLCDAVVAFDECDQLRVGLVLIDEEIARVTPEGSPLRRLCLRVLRDWQGFYCGEAPDPGLLARVRAVHAELLSCADPSPLHYFALRYLGSELWPAESELALEACRQSYEVASRFPNPRHAQGATAELVLHLTYSGAFEESLTALLPIEERAWGQDSFGFLHMSCFHSVTLYESGRFHEAKDVIHSAWRQLPHPRLYPNYWLYSCWSLSRAHEALGEWDEVRSLVDQCREAGVTEPNALELLELWEGLVNCALGNWEEARLNAERARHLFPPSDNPALYEWDLRRRVLEAQVAAGMNTHADARDRLAPILETRHVANLGEYWPAVLTGVKAEADSRTQSGPDKTTDLVLKRLESLVENLPRQGRHWHARYLHARADLARARACDAPDMWDEAVRAWEGLHHIPQVGWAKLHLADASLRHGTRADIPATLSETWEIANHLGAVPLQDAVVDLARRGHVKLQPVAPGAEATPNRLTSLTTRETEVLRLVAQGATNDDLASTLFISSKTASVHVSRILRKLGVSNRSKASAIAYKEGLLAGTRERGDRP